MDGNGRWAKERRLSRLQGHYRGVEVIRKVSRLCRHLGVSHLTLYAFSKENWSRPPAEVRGLMKLLRLYLVNERKELMDNQVKLRVIGNSDNLPGGAQQSLKKTMEITKDNTGLVLTLALSYSGRDEIVRAVNNIVSAAKKSPEKRIVEITCDNFNEWLDTKGYPEPDLLIRTSGELRISNFLLWQLAYTEISVVKSYWPDFSPMDLLTSVADYQKRERRFGGIEAIEPVNERHG